MRWGISLLAFALALPATADLCSDSTVKSIKIPIDHTDADRGSFSYKYRILEGKNPNAPVVIYIPGGPGANSIGNFDRRINDQYSMIFTDPRGGGCNSSQNLKFQDINSENISLDILKLVKTLKLKSYILYGISFGTLVATKVGALAEPNKTQKPKLVVLEGTFDHYVENYNFFPKLWEKAFRTLSPDLQKRFKNSENNPYGLAWWNWQKVLGDILYYGELKAINKNYVSDQLFQLHVDYFIGKKDLPKDFSNFRRSFWKTRGSAMSKRVYKAIACNEMYSSDVFNWVFKSGEITEVNHYPCDESAKNPYDSAKYQIKSPIVYMVGEWDPRTPEHDAYEHSKKQKGAQKWMLEVSKAGHKPLQVNLKDCSTKIWKALLNNQLAQLPQLSKSCTAQVRVRKL